MNTKEVKIALMLCILFILSIVCISSMLHMSSTASADDIMISQEFKEYTHFYLAKTYPSQYFSQRIYVPAGMTNITQIWLYCNNSWTTSTGTLVTGISQSVSTTGWLDGEQFNLATVTTDTWYQCYGVTRPPISVTEGTYYLMTSIPFSSQNIGLYGSNNIHAYDYGKLQYTNYSTTPTWYEYSLSNLTFRIYGNGYSIIGDEVYWPEETTAQVRVVLGYTGPGTTKLGAWLGNTTTSSASFEQNITFQSGVSPGTYTYTLTNLTSGKYYYIRPWSNNSWGFKNDTSELTFLTKPDSPTGLIATTTNMTNISLSWTKATAFESNLTTVIVQSTGTWQYPGAGGEIYNGTGTSVKATGLDPGTEYFFTATSYINGSGSPYYWWYSDIYEHIGVTTLSGYFNVSIKWECNNTNIDLSDANMTHTLTAALANNSVLFSSHPTNATGVVRFWTNDTPYIIYFTYNSTITVPMLVDPGSSNITIYIPCGTVAPITIMFRDYTGFLKPENHAIGYIYLYNGSVRQYVFTGQLQADIAIRPYLTIGNTYHVGVGCDQFTMDDLGPLTITEYSYEINVVMPENTYSMWFSIFNITTGWNVDTLYLDFFDTSYSGTTGGMANATVYLYYLNNDTLINTSIQTVPWDFNYTKVLTNKSCGYKVKLNVTYVQGSQNWDQDIWLIWLPVYQPMYNISGTSESAFVATLGVFIVSYVSFGIAFAAFFVFMIFSPKFAGFAIMAVAVVLGAFKTPMGLLPDSVMSWAVIAGIFMLGLILLWVLKED